MTIPRQKFINQGGAPTLGEARRHLENDQMNTAIRVLSGHRVPRPEPEEAAEPPKPTTHQPDFGGGPRGRLPNAKPPSMTELLKAARRGGYDLNTAGGSDD